MGIYQYTQVHTVYTGIYMGMHRYTLIYTGISGYTSVYTGIYYTGVTGIHGYASVYTVYTGIHHLSQIFIITQVYMGVQICGSSAMNMQ